MKAGAAVNSVDSLGRTPLHYAAERGFPEIIDALIEAGAHLDVFDKTGFTLLFFAAARGRSLIVEHLIAKGARVDIESIQGVTAMHCAVAGRRVRCVRALILAGAPIDNRIVSSAACDTSPSIIRLFVRAGVDMLATIEGIPWTSLDLVTIPCHLKRGKLKSILKSDLSIVLEDVREKGIHGDPYLKFLPIFFASSHSCFLCRSANSLKTVA